MAVLINPSISTTLNQNKENSKSNINNFLRSNFNEHFGNLRDPRIERTKEHLLIDIIAIAILAVIGGSKGWVGIETYGEAKYQWLKEFLELPGGIPSHDTFARVFALLNPEEFQKCFSSWINSITEKFGVDVIAIDGKTLKKSYDKNKKLKALHIVSAWSTSHKLVLGQKKVNKKSNEITAIPALLEMLEIEGSIITIDAMGCQKDIAAMIINKKADYILTLKANHKNFYNELKEWFELAKKENFVGRQYSYYQEVCSGHNRIEKREIWTVPVSSLPFLNNQSNWKGLRTVTMIISERRLGNKKTIAVRFYISSLENNAEKIAKAIRSHWGIENTLHWTLDVTFSEDSSRIRKDNAPENFALLRRLAVNLLKQEKTFKGSLNMKQYKAAMENDYLVKILMCAS